MAETRSGTIRRAVVAALALYALVVGGFVSGLAPALAAPADTGAICGHAEGSGGPQHSPLDHHDCCLVACVCAALGPVVCLSGASAAAWAGRVTTYVAWATLRVAPDALPVTLRRNARGPPSL